METAETEIRSWASPVVASNKNKNKTQLASWTAPAEIRDNNQPTLPEKNHELTTQATPTNLAKNTTNLNEHTKSNPVPTSMLPANKQVQQPPSADAATDIDEHQIGSGFQAAKAPPPPTAADAATDIDENHVGKGFQAAPSPLTAAEAATVFTGDDETALNWTARLIKGLSKSRNNMAKSLASVFGGGKIDEDLYEELETVLLTSDMGIEATGQLMKEVRDRVSLKGLKDAHELRLALKEALYDLIKPLEQPLVLPENGQPFVIMMAGINGAGKTTSIGKLAKYFQSQGKTVMLAAGDTFRAAAREQLQEWGERNGVTVISQASGDSAAVCFDAVESAKAKKIDIVLADTAGRLPTQLHLMEEIKKVKRVLQKAMPDAPHEIIVVLDANIGQNAINQVIAFDDALGVTGLIVTKLDGTAKGGILAALASNRAIPVRYIGVGESIDDLRPFNARDFIDALLDEQI
ncbi:MAG: signal recognition particle-docking protein FtsY [Alysiella sp.]|uniref:signal recognition particle-docking protein FtsY n=1 Tax=Alysiella sp. TaxID=1872483 RepID=UPI0026DD8E78|nr:signal recognition particle-docking protein FtsY [Alysiella sp.]MDO4433253.1 signal recognition particle-docking protein FtsY [Alysiella sp.]